MWQKLYVIPLYEDTVYLTVLKLFKSHLLIDNSILFVHYDSTRYYITCGVTKVCGTITFVPSQRVFCVFKWLDGFNIHNMS